VVAVEMKTLFEWAGGEKAIRRLIDAFYDRVEGDELLSPFAEAKGKGTK
jgi:hemoglobin